MGSGVGGSTERIQLPGWVGALIAVEHWERPYTRGGGAVRKVPWAARGLSVPHVSLVSTQ